MKQVMRGLLFLLLVFTAANVRAQNFLYTNNNPFGALNTVSAYSVAADGTLTPVPGSPFSTGGTGSGGGFFASSRIAVCAVGNFLYVANDGSNNVSAFSIDTGTGALTTVPGSPFATGGVAGNGISLAATPDGAFLFAALAGSANIRVFAKDPDTGALTPVGPLVPAGGAVPISAKVSPNGSFLMVALNDVGPHGAVRVFSIDSSGGLTVVGTFNVRGPGAPTGGAAGVDINCANSFVTVGEAAFETTIVDVLSLADDGTLAPIDGSPFNPNAGFNSNVPLLSPDDSTLFVSNQVSDTVTVFSASSDGSLTLVGAFFAGGSSPTVAGMATDQEGTLLYAAKLQNLISVFSIGKDGTLTFVANTIVPGNVAIESLTAFPGKTCSSSKAQAR